MGTKYYIEGTNIKLRERKSNVWEQNIILRERKSNAWEQNKGMSSIHNGGSGPLFDGSTEPASPSPQQCLVLQPSSLSVASGPLFDGDRPTEPPAVIGFTTTSPLCGFWTTFRREPTRSRQEIIMCVWDNQPKTKTRPSPRPKQPTWTNTMGPAPPPGGPIHRTIEPDLMQSVHPCDI